MIDEVVAAIRCGRPVVLPTDTVYGLCTSPDREEPVRNLYRLKGRPETQPMALVASGLDTLFRCVPELHGAHGMIAAALLPGPYTLVLANPAHRFRWLTGATPAAIGVRVPLVTGDARSVLERVGAVAATSANRAGGRDPSRLEEVPVEIRSACAAVLDGGELPGRPSTVIDFTGTEPRVIREGAGDVAGALTRAAEALAGMRR